MAQELAKATVKVLAGREPGREFQVFFNPTEYNLEIANNFQEAAPPGLSSPIIQFVNGQTPVLTMDLLFDTYTDGGGQDVSQLTGQFAGLLEIDPDLHAPPPVEFKWGVFAFKAVIDKLSQRFTMFLSDGTPVRATLNVSFKQYRTLSEQLQDPRRLSSDRTKRRVFAADDRLSLIAAREYGEARFWRVIARHNRIENPFALRPGDVLVLPPLEQQDLLEAPDAP